MKLSLIVILSFCMILSSCDHKTSCESLVVLERCHINATVSTVYLVSVEPSVLIVMDGKCLYRFDDAQIMMNNHAPAAYYLVQRRHKTLLKFYPTITGRPDCIVESWHIKM